MAASPFAFYRGSAVIMAADLATVPVSGLRVQACGDAHVANFGGFATPERNVDFDVNDFDETLPAPWEWDVLRMAASIALAGRHHHHSRAERHAAVIEGARAYRKAMRHMARLSPLDVWYEHLDLRKVIKRAPRVQRHMLTQTLSQAKREPPAFVHDPESLRSVESRVADDARNVLRRYRETLLPHIRTLFDRYELRDIALKVVGVGSVGTLCLAALFATAEGDPLVLQLKEAQASVLERYAGPSRYAQHGERVVNGQRLMQAASDIFLGWTTSAGKDFYVRQLRDVKVSIDVARITPGQLRRYAGSCGWTLARAHARSGDPAAIAAAAGSGKHFDPSVARFARTYADVTEADYALFIQNVIRKAGSSVSTA